METKEIVATLKASLVNDIIFEKEMARYSTELSFRNDFKVNVGIKVGNTVKETYLLVTSKYNSNTIGNYDYTHTINKRPFESLIEAGIDIDFGDVLETYKIAVAINKELQEAEKVERKRLQKIALGKDYDNSWIHTLSMIVDNKLKNFKFTRVPISKDDYVNGDRNIGIIIKYKNINVKLYREDGKYCFCDGYKLAPTDEYPDRRESLYISDHKVRRGKNGKGMIYKVLTHIDEYLVIRENIKNRKEREEKQRNDTHSILEKNSGLSVKRDTEWRSAHNRNEQGRSVEIFTISIGERTIKVNTQMYKPYKDGAYLEERRIYTLGSFGNLSLKQFKDIIKTLK